MREFCSLRGILASLTLTAGALLLYFGLGARVAAAVEVSFCDWQYLQCEIGCGGYNEYDPSCINQFDCEGDASDGYSHCGCVAGGPCQSAREQ